MVVFPNAKINLGLNITARRTDGYHDLDMVMIPVDWCDVLEIVPAKGNTTTLNISGRDVNCPMEQNLVYRAYQKLNENIGEKLPAVDIYLHKIIPDGAGLGGGSADAAFTLLALNELFSLGLGKDKLADIAFRLGADCPFFIYNRPMHCSGIGNEMRPIDINLGDDVSILIAKPVNVSVSTAEAYGGVCPVVPEITTDTIVSAYQPIDWRDKLFNGFEQHIFKAKPRIAEIKRMMYEHGASYASMSGSGSAVYGIFYDAKMAECAANSLNDCDCHIDRIAHSVKHFERYPQ